MTGKSVKSILKHTNSKGGCYDIASSSEAWNKAITKVSNPVYMNNVNALSTLERHLYNDRK